MKANEPKVEWLRVNEATNALDCLKRVCSFALQAEEDQLAWKWVVIALHSALYDFAVCASKGTAADAIVRKTKKGLPRLLEIGKILELCQDEAYMRGWFNGHAIRLSSEQRKSFKLLKDIRDQFEHFQPMHWKIAYQELPSYAMHILDIIHALSETGTWFPPSNEYTAELRSTIVKRRSILAESRAHREFKRIMETQANANPSGYQPPNVSSELEIGEGPVSCQTVFTRPETGEGLVPEDDSGQT